MESSLSAASRPTAIDGNENATRAVIIVGAGPVGLCAAIDLGLQGVDTLLVDQDETLCEGSRAICFSKRTLEILDRLGCADPAVAKGVVWNTGKVFLRDRLLYQFNLQPEAGYRRPAFINLQQYHLEQFLLDRLQRLPVELRWRSKVIDVTARGDGVSVAIEGPDDVYHVHGRYLLACDGARSPIREMLELEARGQIFRDRFLIADVKMQADFPAERWFWFDPPFHPRQSALLHRQADNVWRIDFQLGWDADPELERQPERVIPRIEAMLGPQRPFELQWVSVYTFRCQRMEQFRHGRVLFAGDSAHQVSPFGARGANGGIQDADNLVWKLARVVRKTAPESLLDSYDAERGPAADENILNSARSTDFITPKNRASRAFRDATLQLAQRYPFARALVNSGRLSLPHFYRHSSLNTMDQEVFAGGLPPGAPAADAPLDDGPQRAWLVAQLGTRFVGLYFTGATPADAGVCSRLLALANLSEPVYALVISEGAQAAQWRRQGVSAFEDTEGLAARRYDARAGTFYLIRPDQHVAARWRRLDVRAVRDAVARAIGVLSPEFAAWQS
jgi:3-(3-hydroxy-phenyl)propionate hydroxylase